MVTRLALDDTNRGGFVEAFTQLLGLPVCMHSARHTLRLPMPSPHPGLRLLIPEPGEPDFSDAADFSPYAALRKLLPIVGMCNSLVIVVTMYAR